MMTPISLCCCPSSKSCSICCCSSCACPYGLCGLSPSLRLLVPATWSMQVHSQAAVPTEMWCQAGRLAPSRCDRKWPSLTPPLADAAAPDWITDCARSSHGHCTITSGTAGSLLVTRALHSGQPEGQPCSTVLLVEEGGQPQEVQVAPGLSTVNTSSLH